MLGIIAVMKEGEEDILDKKRAFRSGINWFLDNLWHDASEEPKENIDILVEYLYDNDRKFVKLGFHKPSFYPWQQKIINERITRWLYIDDLRKGGTHE